MIYPLVFDSSCVEGLRTYFEILNVAMMCGSRIGNAVLPPELVHRDRCYNFQHFVSEYSYYHPMLSTGALTRFCQYLTNYSSGFVDSSMVHELNSRSKQDIIVEVGSVVEGALFRKLYTMNDYVDATMSDIRAFACDFLEGEVKSKISLLLTLLLLLPEDSNLEKYRKCKSEHTLEIVKMAGKKNGTVATIKYRGLLNASMNSIKYKKLAFLEMILLHLMANVLYLTSMVEATFNTELESDTEPILKEMLDTFTSWYTKKLFRDFRTPSTTKHDKISYKAYGREDRYGILIFGRVLITKISLFIGYASLFPNYDSKALRSIFISDDEIFLEPEKISDDVEHYVPLRTVHQLDYLWNLICGIDYINTDNATSHGNPFLNSRSDGGGITLCDFNCFDFCASSGKSTYREDHMSKALYSLSSDITELGEPSLEDGSQCRMLIRSQGVREFKRSFDDLFDIFDIQMLPEVSTEYIIMKYVLGRRARLYKVMLETFWHKDAQTYRHVLRAVVNEIDTMYRNKEDVLDFLGEICDVDMRLKPSKAKLTIMISNLNIYMIKNSWSREALSYFSSMTNEILPDSHVFEHITSSGEIKKMNLSNHPSWSDCQVSKKMYNDYIEGNFFESFWKAALTTNSYLAHGRARMRYSRDLSTQKDYIYFQNGIYHSLNYIFQQSNHYLGIKHVGTSNSGSPSLYVEFDNIPFDALLKSRPVLNSKRDAICPICEEEKRVSYAYREPLCSECLYKMRIEELTSSVNDDEQFLFSSCLSPFSTEMKEIHSGNFTHITNYKLEPQFTMVSLKNQDHSLIFPFDLCGLFGIFLRSHYMGLVRKGTGLVNKSKNSISKVSGLAAGDGSSGSAKETLVSYKDSSGSTAYAVKNEEGATTTYSAALIDSTNGAVTTGTGLATDPTGATEIADGTTVQSNRTTVDTSDLSDPATSLNSYTAKDGSTQYAIDVGNGNYQSANIDATTGKVTIGSDDVTQTQSTR
jgi:hypothetical protein